MKLLNSRITTNPRYLKRVLGGPNVEKLISSGKHRLYILRVGDKVKNINPNSKLFGVEGTIIEIHSDPDLLHFRWNVNLWANWFVPWTDEWKLIP